MNRHHKTALAVALGLSVAIGTAAVQDWSTTPASNNAAPPNGAPEGMAPGAVNDVMRQMMADIAVEAQVNRVKRLNSVSGTNTITASMTPSLTAYSAGMVVVLQPAGNNTGATTLNINSLGALDVQKYDGDALISGDLVTGVPALLVLDSGGDDWILINPQSNDVSAAAILSRLLTVDGAGSGLDADLLDGQSGAYYQNAGNLNAGTLAVARGGTGVTSSTGTGNVVLSASPTLTGTVIAATINATTLQQGGSGVWTAANDGAGSGLDADLLDGLSSASFAAASHTHAASAITSGQLAIAQGGTGNANGLARNITGKAGVAKTLSTSAPSGGSDGDVWYRY